MCPTSRDSTMAPPTAKVASGIATGRELLGWEQRGAHFNRQLRRSWQAVGAAAVVKAEWRLGTDLSNLALLQPGRQRDRANLSFGTYRQLRLRWHRPLEQFQRPSRRWFARTPPT